MVQRLTEREFKMFREIVYRESGIHLSAGKRDMLSTRLSRRMRTLGFSAEQYLDRIRKDPEEMTRFLDAVSTNHTFFFRERRSFRYLSADFRNIWSAASSSGEEAYSIATWCRELGGSPRILATDISSECLRQGERGVYAMKAADQIPEAMLKRYFQKGHGQWEGYLRVKAEIRESVSFRAFNLLKDTPPETRFDAIFCRNVMIYFDNPTKEAVVRRLSGALKRGGYFIIGGAESLSGISHPFKYVEPSVYRKP